MKGLMGDGGSARALINWAVMSAVVVVALIMGPAKAFSLNMGDITTIAGNGVGGYGGDGGPATSAMISAHIGGGPYMGVAVDPSGNLFIADYNNNRIRKVDTNGIITTVAGTGTAGYSGDGGQAIAAQLSHPMGVAFDSSSNMYIVDEYNHLIRKVSTSGIITTVAGNVNAAGFSGDGGPAAGAKLYYPTGIAVDSTGNLYITDSGNNRIRKVNTSGTITTVAGNGNAGYSGDGGLATAAMLNAPIDVKVDNAGNLFFTDYSNQRIRKINTSGIIGTVAGTGTGGFSGDGGQATAAMLNGPFGVAVDSGGNLSFADWGNNRIRKVAPNGIISTVAGTGSYGFSGDGGPAIGANVFSPTGITFDNAGNLILADSANSRIRMVFTGAVPTYTINTSATGGNGSITPASSTVNYGSNVTLTISPVSGYHLASLTDNGVNVIGSGNLVGNSYTISNITANHNVVATFAAYGIAVDFSHPANCTSLYALTDNGANVLGSLISNIYTIKPVAVDHYVIPYFANYTYTITSSVNGSNGSISPTRTVNACSDTVITITPATGYHLATLTDNSSNVTGSVNNGAYTIPNVNTNHNVIATFAANSYTINASVSGGNGTIAPASSQISYNNPITLHITPTAPYGLATLTDNGVDVTSSVVNGDYTINTVRADHTVVATFALRSYTITASVAAGSGSITPTSSYATKGSNATLIITPIAGSNLVSLIDNNIDVTARVINNTYTITTIDTDHTVSATFGLADTTPPTLTVSTLADGSVTNNAVLNVTGTITDNVGVKSVSINNVIIPVNTDGSFSYALALANGPNTVTVIATDLAGNQSPANSRTITLDQTAPSLTVTAPADNSKTAVSLVTVTGTVSESATVVVKLGDTTQNAVMNGLDFSANLNLVPGINTIRVIATDAAGNKSYVKRTVIYDDQIPTLAITNPNQDISTDQSGLTISGIAFDPYTVVTVSITMDGQTYTPAVVNGQFEQAVTFTTAKTYTILVTATNAVGASATVQRNVIYAPPADTYTKLLLHMDGDDGSTTFVDSSPAARSVTASGSAQVSASYAKFSQGGSFNGQNASYLSIPNSTDWVFGNSDFTVEGWFYLSGTNQPYTCLIATTSGVDHSGWAINLNSTGTKARFVAGDNSTAWKVELVGTTTLSTNAWHHVAVARSGNVFKLFLDGVQEATATNAVTISDVGIPLRLASFVSYNAPLLGYLDEIRISNGIARWTADFTPPTAPY